MTIEATSKENEYSKQCVNYFQSWNMGTTNKLLQTALRKRTHNSRQPEAVIVTYHHTAGLGLVVQGESPGCRLISAASMLEWLRTPPPPLTGEQYGKMEPKYPEGGHCQSVLRPQGVFNVPLYFK